MSTITLNGSGLGDGLLGLLLANDIVPGDRPSYQLCKDIYSYHVLGAKLAEIPIRLAQAKPRLIAVPGTPEERIRKAFVDQWKADGCDKHIFNLHRLKRIYGVAAMGVLIEDKAPADPIDYDALWKDTISFNVWDPLNVAGSLTGNLQPNSPGFLKTTGVAVNGIPYHRSRTIIVLNEEPIYLEWTQSAFGYVGRSVYQRTLFPLKSYIQTMVTDDLVAKKAGVLVAMMKQAGSIIDSMMQGLFARKRQVVQDAATGNVIGIGHEEKIESLNLQNVNGAMDASRNHILENIAAGAGMPAILVNSETYVQGFSEGTEDARAVADYVEHERDEMTPTYAWMDNIIQHRAWNPEFYATIQADFPEQYGEMEYKTALYQWRNAFSATWPSLLTEPDSEKAKYDDVRLKALVAVVEILLPAMDPENRATTIKWLADNLNELTRLFSSPLDLDYEALEAYEPPAQEMNTEQEPHEPKPFAAQDADRVGERVRKAIARVRSRGDGMQSAAVEDLIRKAAEAAKSVRQLQ